LADRLRCRGISLFRSCWKRCAGLGRGMSAACGSQTDCPTKPFCREPRRRLFSASHLRPQRAFSGLIQSVCVCSSNPPGSALPTPTTGTLPSACPASAPCRTQILLAESSLGPALHSALGREHNGRGAYRPDGRADLDQLDRPTVACPASYVLRNSPAAKCPAAQLTKKALPSLASFHGCHDTRKRPFLGSIEAFFTHRASSASLCSTANSARKRAASREAKNRL
jgi:hypothetical protein